MRGPQLATGLIVWSHGYLAGKNSTRTRRSPGSARFTHLGYDLYRFDREWIADWRAMPRRSLRPYARRASWVIAASCSPGNRPAPWVSLAALARSAPVDGVISIAAAHHGKVDKMHDTTRARSEWQHVIEALKPGPRVVLVNFADDDYDVGGRMGDARSIFAKSGVNAVIVDDPPGFKGHGAGGDFTFARKFGPCIQAFVEAGNKQQPC